MSVDQEYHISAPASVKQVVAQGHTAAQRGDRRSAYRLALQATQTDPNNADAWLLRAENAPSHEERLLSLSYLANIDPHHPRLSQEMYAELRRQLEREPFLKYLEEDTWLYRVRNGPALAIAVPKDRAQPEPYPPQRPATVRLAYRWLMLAAAGLLVAGIGAFLLAPVAAVTALLALSQPLNANDHRRALVALGVSALLWLAALPLGLLFILHLLQG